MIEDHFNIAFDIEVSLIQDYQPMRPLAHTRLTLSLPAKRMPFPCSPILEEESGRAQPVLLEKSCNKDMNCTW